MNMRSLTTTALTLTLLSGRAFAQCGMTTYIGVTQGCHVNQQAMVFTNSGTPPYTIVIEKQLLDYKRNASEMGSYADTFPIEVK